MILKQSQWNALLRSTLFDSMVTWLDNGYVFASSLGRHVFGDKIDLDDDSFLPHRRPIGEWDLWRLPDGTAALVVLIFPTLLLPLVCL